MPNYEQYEKKLQSIVNDAEKSIDLSEISKLISSEVYSYVKQFSTSKGSFNLDSDSVKLLNRFTNALNNSITSKKAYRNSVLNFLTKVKDVGNLQLDFFSEAKMPLLKSEVSVGQQIVIDELIKQYTENGLNEKLIEPVRRMLRQSILGKGGVDVFNNQVQKMIPENLVRFNSTTAKAGIDGYQSVINKKLYEKYESKITHIRMTNTLIDTSSPQCKMVVKDYDREFPISEWSKIKNVAEENGLIEGTNVSNLGVNKLHWGCRHSFYPIIKV